MDVRDDPRISRILVEFELRHAWEAINGLTTRRDLLSIHRDRALAAGDMATVEGLDKAMERCAEAERRIRAAAGLQPWDEQLERVEVRLP